MTESLSIEQARKLVLHSQRIPPARPVGLAIDATLSALEHLGYVQIDTISAVQRAHHHVLWSRNPRYQLSHLDQLVEERKVFEYWSHAAAYLPMRDYRFSLPRKLAIKTGEQSHWFKPDKKVMKYVHDRIAGEGALMARDFEHGGRKPGGWGSKPAKQALETLFMQGDLMVARRDNFHKVYDLTERVVPAGTERTVPSPEEHARFLITRYLEANGLGQVAEITYLRKHVRPQVASALDGMMSAGEVVPVSVADKKYYALPESLELLDKPLSRSRLKILSPFDNLLIQRKRMKDLFDFDYQLECYVPEAKRKFGYFTLPILWNGRLVARMDCKVDRKESVLYVHNFAFEPGVQHVQALAEAFNKELKLFLQFNGCTRFINAKPLPLGGS